MRWTSQTHGTKPLSQVVSFKMRWFLLQVNAEKLQNVQQKLEGFLAQEKEQKERAQRCFVSYLRSVYLMKNKEVFDVFQLQVEEYAQSLGLAVAPRVRFLSKALLQKAEKTEQTAEEQSEDEQELRSFKAQLKGAEEDSSDSEDGSGDEADGTQGQLQCAEHEDDLRDVDLLTVKRKDVFNLTGKQESLEEPDGESSKRKMSKETKYKEAKKVLKKNFQVNKKVIFNEEEEAVQVWPPVQRTVGEDEEEEDEVSGINVEKARERLKREDQEFDKPEYSRKVKAKHREQRMKAKAAGREARKKKQKSEEEEEDEVVAYLANHSEDEFDPNSLPDPDKLSSEEDEATEGRSTKRQRGSDSSDEDEEQPASALRKKRTRPQAAEADEGLALDTGLSLAEDEELVLHLLRGSR